MAEKETAKRKTLVGKVVKHGSANTIKVRIERKIMHPIYRKVVKTHRNILVHFEGDAPEVGQMILIQETRPISKLKSWVYISEEEK